MMKKFKEFLNESNDTDNLVIGDYEFWADKRYGNDRIPYKEYYIVYGEYEGHLIIEHGKHSGESYEYLAYIEWDNEPENWEEIEEFVGSNLDKILTESPVI